jgi:hypothetical protein
MLSSTGSERGGCVSIPSQRTTTAALLAADLAPAAGVEFTLTSQAQALVRSALRAAGDPGTRTRELLRRYYAVEGPHAGISFLDGTEGEHPETVQAADLFAVSMLGLPVPPAAARRVLHDTAWARRIEACLETLPVQATLVGTEAPPLVALRALHDGVLAAIDPRPQPSEVSRVVASAVCARKRPELFPVIDTPLCDALLLPGPGYPVRCWQAVRAVLRADGVVDALTRAFRSLHRDQPGLAVDVYPLRQLQVLLSLPR